MKTFTAIVEKCSETGMFVGHVPGVVGAHTQSETLDELQKNLLEVISMLVEDSDFKMESEFVGTQLVTIG